ncbi:MAG: bifunctional oligoribonuclease/PAP phosphatase NrnA [Ktedonobacterales bacterium]|nr:bifunctional oligoribonuclease/PAP phosphatase NrnA [Ktedonobacterales bacterium]
MTPALVTLPAAIDPALASAARRLVDHATRIVILAHQNPDADALGSGLGLAHALHGLGKTAIVACPDPAPPDFASFLPGLDTVVTTLDGPPFDLVVALDAGELSRYGDLYARYAALLRDAPILNMDHHVTSKGCGVVNIIDTKAAATAELLTLWLTQEGIAISHDAARCLLAGIITDTRAFEFDATTARTMLVGSYLMSLGAVPLDVIKPIYRMRSLPAARLFGLVAATLASDVAGRLTWAEITPAMWEAADLDVGSPDGGVTSFLIDITGVEIAILFRQLTPESVRLSIRTAGAQDATILAGRFGGGGHPRAAGCTILAPLAEAKVLALAAAREQLGTD